jgi:hypothetical protein
MLAVIRLSHQADSVLRTEVLQAELIGTAHPSPPGRISQQQ